MAQQRAHLGGRKIIFNDKLKSSAAHTIGELGCDFDNALLLSDLTMVSTRRKRSSVVGAAMAIQPTTEGFILPPFPLPWRHWPLIGEYLTLAVSTEISLLHA